MIEVRNQEGATLTVRMLRRDTLRKLLAAACQKWGLEPSKIRLVYYGDPLVLSFTPADLQLEDGDILECFLQQVGD